MWITVVPIVHVGKKRVGKLLPLRIEPGRKLVRGSSIEIRKRPYEILATGYEEQTPVVHVLTRIEHPLGGAVRLQ